MRMFLLLTVLLICGCDNRNNSNQLLSELENVKVSHDAFIKNLKGGRAIAFLNSELVKNENRDTKILIQINSVISTNEPAYVADNDNPFSESKEPVSNSSEVLKISKLGDYYFTLVDAVNLYTEITGAKWIIHNNDILIVLTKR